MKKENLILISICAFAVLSAALIFGPLSSLAVITFAGVSIIFILRPFYGIVALVLLLPLEIVLASGETGSRISLLKLVSFLTFGGICLRFLSSRRAFHRSPVNRYILLFMFAWVLSLVSGDNPDTSLALVKDIVWFVSLFLIGLYGVESVEKGKTLMTIFLLVMALISLFGYFQVIAGSRWISSFIFSPAGELLSGPWTREIQQWDAQGKPLYWYIGLDSPRIVGTFYSPNYYCAFLGYPVSFALAYFLREEGKEKSVALFLWLLFTGNVILTYSRGGWLAFFLSTLTVIIIARRSIKPSIIFLVSIPLMLGILAITDTFSLISERFLSLTEPVQSNPRYDMWVAILEQIKQKPIFGYGYWGEVFTRRYPYGVHAHNLYLELLYAVGITGISFFLVIVVKTMHAAFRGREAPGFHGTYSIGYFGALVWFLCHNAVDFQFHHAKNGGVFWLSLGIFFALWNCRKETEA